MPEEAETLEHHIEPYTTLDPKQLPLISLRTLQSNARALVIVLEVEAMLIEGHQVVFEECFQNTNDSHMVTHLSDDIRHRLWLQGPVNHLSSTWRASYIAIVL